MARKIGMFRNALYLYLPWAAKLQEYLDKRKELKRLKLLHNALPTGQDSPAWAAWRKHCKHQKEISQARVTRANKEATALRKALGQPDYFIRV